MLWVSGPMSGDFLTPLRMRSRPFTIASDMKTGLQQHSIQLHAIIDQSNMLEPSPSISVLSYYVMLGKSHIPRFAPLMICGYPCGMPKSHVGDNDTAFSGALRKKYHYDLWRAICAVRLNLRDHTAPFPGSTIASISLAHALDA
jgi:hypothetical protein